MSIFMFFAQIELARILPIFIAQPASAILFFYLAVKLLVRKREHFSISLAIFYIISAVSLIINLVYVILSNFISVYLILFLLYYTTAYLLIVSFIFLIFFLNLLLNFENTLNSKRNLTILMIYIIACFFILLFPDGIRLDPSKNWRPIYTLEFLLVIYIYFTTVIFIPAVFFSFKLYRRFEAKNLKKKFRLLIIGIIEMLTLLYGTVLFNTTIDPTIRFIWGILSLLMLISSAFLIYVGIGGNP